VGFHREDVRCERAERFVGATTYRLGKFSLDAVANFNYAPLGAATTR